MIIRRAEERDIPDMHRLLGQVEMVHHVGRPDWFKYKAFKYNNEELAELIKKMETEKKTIEQSLVKYLGENESTEAENSKFYVKWISYDTPRIDTDLLKSEAPEIYERYKKTSTVSRLTIKAAA